MAYNVNSYFIFLPTVALLYQLVKKERRWWVLLGASVVFFWLISRQLILWAVVTAGITYSIAGWIDRTQVQIKAIDRSEKERRNALKEKSRKILQLGLLGTVGILVALKYTAFTVETTMHFVLYPAGGELSAGRVLEAGEGGIQFLQAVPVPDLLPDGNGRSDSSVERHQGHAVQRRADSGGESGAGMFPDYLGTF